MSAVGSKLAIFTLAMLAIGGALCYPAALWGGQVGQIALLAAWSLSVIPGWVLLAAHALVRSPRQGVFLALGSTTCRLLFVGFGSLVIFNQGWLPEQQFAVWVIVCYLAALAVETGLMLRSAPRLDESAAAMAFSLLVNPRGR